MNEISSLIFIFSAKYLPLVITGIFFVWFLTQPKSRQKEILIIACAYLPLVLLISWAASLLYYNPRPFVVGHFEPLIPHKANNGFPSHHMLLASTAAALAFMFNRRLGLVLWVLAAFAGLFRVCAGVHHMVDIAGSALISVIALVLVRLCVFRRRK
jgi:undecaprenyl-diphosphatase